MSLIFKKLSIVIHAIPKRFHNNNYSIYPYCRGQGEEL